MTYSFEDSNSQPSGLQVSAHTTVAPRDNEIIDSNLITCLLSQDIMLIEINTDISSRE